MATTQTVTFGLGLTAYFLLGLDDERAAAQVYPTLRHVRRSRYEASAADASALLDALETRGAMNSGYDHDALERRALNDAARRLRADLAASSSPVTSTEGR